MKSNIVADGDARRRRSPEYRARLRALRATVRARHAEALAAAGFFRRLLIHWRIAAEFRRERRAIEPSRKALYGRLEAHHAFRPS